MTITLKSFVRDMDLVCFVLPYEIYSLEFVRLSEHKLAVMSIVVPFVNVSVRVIFGVAVVI